MTTKLTYTLGGLLFGLLLGSLVGLGESNYIKKSIRGQTIPILALGGAVIGGLVGISFGYKMGEKVHKEFTTGISKASISYLKDGRYWIGTTKWADTRQNTITNILETRRVTQKKIVTFLNDTPIHVHDTESASKESIGKCHKSIQLQVFKIIIDSFDENNPKQLEELIPSIKNFS